MIPDTFIVDGHAYSWKRLCELRRLQLEALRKARASQLALFALQDDHRPAHERTAANRYREPGLLDLMGPSATTRVEHTSR